jgi:acetolactate decarboxylase
MKRIFKYFGITVLLICGLNAAAFAQKKTSQAGTLFSAGYAAGFIGGLYDAFYPYSKLKQHGDFGLGAPAKLDGELIMLNGQLYKTQATGKTVPLGDTDKTPYALVCFFHPQKVYKPGKAMNKAALYHYLDSVLTNQNGIYAIHISGTFGYIKTRAFPPVEQKPYLPLAAMLDRQHFFEFHDVKGDLAGYRSPAFLEGQLISGYHFHFLADTKDHGGHIIDVVANDVVIEIDELTGYSIDLPQTADFNNFDFKKDRKEEIKSVENGKKQ